MSKYWLKNGDCIEWMKKLNDKSVDLIVTDPPYGMNYRSNRRTATEKFNKIANDSDTDIIPKAFEQMYRVLKDGSACYAFCSWHHIDVFKQEFEKYFKLKNILIWNKNNHGSGDLKGAYAPKYEMVLFGTKGRHILNGKRISDVIDCDKVSGSQMTHPTEKPIDLLKLFIDKSSGGGQTVLDPFMGTGSCGIASMELDRNFIGIELDKNYFDVANKRIGDVNR